ncbi:MAG: DUF1828 domain-containing protein [Chloracidobacterium sp.]
MNAQELCAALQADWSSLFECSPAPKEGVLRVRTPFMYPDGGVIDVFVLPRDGGFEVTDFGEALGWLRMQSVRGHLSAKQYRLVQDICLTLGVEFFHGQIMLRCEKNTVSQAVVRVGQSALRLADLWFTLRRRAVETVSDEVGDWLQEKVIPFEREVRHVGRSGRSWTVDYQTRTAQRTCLVFVLSTGSRAAARRVTEHVVTGLYDLSHLRVVQPALSFVSLFDDTEDVWQEEDFRLVEGLSTIVHWSRPDEFENVLKAA